eukprot:3870153-Pleurochrysis_carterae.AAC.4
MSASVQSDAPGLLDAIGISATLLSYAWEPHHSLFTTQRAALYRRRTSRVRSGSGVPGWEGGVSTSPFMTGRSITQLGFQIMKPTRSQLRRCIV